MEVFTEEKCCKYCEEKIEICISEGLECTECRKQVHLKCLKRGSVPGGLYGDVFFSLTCQECSTDEMELFTRMKLSWLQVIVLVLFHLQNKSPGLARKGFFHWRHHVAKFIDKNWEIIFTSDVKRKKKWTGTIAGTLSHFSNYIFLSGTSVVNETAFWTLMYPKLTPFAISSIYSVMAVEKQQLKNKKEKVSSDADLFNNTIFTCMKNVDLLQIFSSVQIVSDVKEDSNNTIIDMECNQKDLKPKNSKRISVQPQFETSSKKMMKLVSSTAAFSNDLATNFKPLDQPEKTDDIISNATKEDITVKEFVKLLDPFCHYNTSLNNISRMKGLTLHAKLTGGIRPELILSPYSEIYLKPYIRRDTETFPVWLKLMAEVQLAGNKNDKQYHLPPRGPIDYTYIQPQHIPAINSICNQFFWPGIDLTETLQYPDFSCVVLYKRLIIGFAFLVPDVNYTENYLSFIFTRPYWRNCGIAKFMIYHLIQTSLGRDITVHVSINNPALLLYQKFGFKVENVVLGFYDKYLRSDVNDSKDAFFCRLER
ncbi:unnamed protein product [Phaedon cochleariae]|uniref:Cysteine-rich protein 2-binding protein n=1 Tax=Phaedon cochleariae TaxID=80249 RepID=A0A9P0DCE6_PHACE|nr:unnamed protein product [Phaedon cochleariae]